MNTLLHRSKVFFKRNSSTILTGAGVVGVIATSVMSVKATPKAIILLKKAEDEKGEKLTKTEIVRVAGPVYIPSIAIGASTIACIIGANILSKYQQAALMSAYALADSSYKEYKKKVEALYGEDADEYIQNEIAKDKYKEHPVIPIDNKQLFYDAFSRRFFESTLEDVMNAEYKLNRQIAVATGACLNEFYEFLDIPSIPSGMVLGWSNGILESHYWTNWVDFQHSEKIKEDGTKYTYIFMMQEPVIDYAYY